MADDVRITNFPDSSAKERVAFDLYRDVMNAENKTFGAAEGTGRKPDRKYLLDLYVECYNATKGRRS